MMNPGGKALAVAPGDRHDKLVAVERLPNDPGGNQVWSWRCDCGALYRSRASNVTYTVRTIGWASCRECYRAAGGYDGIVAARGGGTCTSER
jgi:hypothetical protein